MRGAIFLDRDGTIIENVPYLTDPAEVRLLPGAADAVRRLREAGYAAVLVTNQSAIGRGLLSAEEYAAVHDALTAALEAEGVTLDGHYHCPAAPTGDDPNAIEHPDRKPAAGMLTRAAEELDLDVSRSWMIGDKLTDAIAGRNAGCHGTILVRTGPDAPPEDHDVVDHVVADLAQAADIILSDERA